MNSLINLYSIEYYINKIHMINNLDVKIIEMWYNEINNMLDLEEDIIIDDYLNVNCFNDQMLPGLNIENRCICCYNCDYCSDCIRCSNCVNCNTCEYCDNCNLCYNCNCCNNCKECSNCNIKTIFIYNRPSVCTNCNNCNNCADCNNCKYCDDCFDCTDCNRCIDCKKCYQCKVSNICRNCTDCTNCNNCFNLNNHLDERYSFNFSIQNIETKMKKFKPKYLNPFLANISDLYIKLNEEGEDIIDDKPLINEMEDFKEFNKIDNVEKLKDIIKVIVLLKKNNIYNTYYQNIIYNILYLGISTGIQLLSMYKIIEF